MDELKEKIAKKLCKLETGSADVFNMPSLEKAKTLWLYKSGELLRTIEEAGFAVVPKEPTAAMIEAGRIADPLSCDVDESDIAMVYGRIYSGMVSAACTPLNLEEPRG